MDSVVDTERCKALWDAPWPRAALYKNDFVVVVVRVMLMRCTLSEKVQPISSHRLAHTGNLSIPISTHDSDTVGLILFSSRSIGHFQPGLLVTDRSSARNRITNRDCHFWHKTRQLLRYVFTPRSRRLLVISAWSSQLFVEHVGARKNRVLSRKNSSTVCLPHNSQLFRYKQDFSKNTVK